MKSKTEWEENKVSGSKLQFRKYYIPFSFIFKEASLSLHVFMRKFVLQHFWTGEGMKGGKVWKTAGQISSFFNWKEVEAQSLKKELAKMLLKTNKINNSRFQKEI